MGLVVSPVMAGFRRNELIIMVAIAIVTAVAAGINYGPGPSFVSFLFATVALAGLAWLIAFGTEQLGESFGPEVTGVLQSTLGNLPEFFVVLFALSAGQVVVAQMSIIGSIFANALLVLGMVIVVGAWKGEDGLMRFKQELPNDTATLFLLAVFVIVALAIAHATHAPVSRHVTEVSIIGSVCLLTVYTAWVARYIRTGAAGELGHSEPPRVGPRTAAGVLAVAGAAAAFVSEWFVAGLDPAIDALHISEAFAGLVIVAIAGNAIENTTGLVLAAKGQSDLAISVVKNSVSQISVFLFPLLILVSLAFNDHLTFAIDPVYVGALAMTAFVIWQITVDGVAAVWEGLALVAFYVMLAAITLYQ
jgi:Ca2+:H+ antiporter